MPFSCPLLTPKRGLKRQGPAPPRSSFAIRHLSTRCRNRRQDGRFPSVNRRVAGSSPARGATLLKSINQQLARLMFRRRAKSLSCSVLWTLRPHWTMSATGVRFDSGVNLLHRIRVGSRPAASNVVERKFTDPSACRRSSRLTSWSRLPRCPRRSRKDPER